MSSAPVLARTASRRARSTQVVADPRVVGGTYWSGYGAFTYVVDFIEFDATGFLTSITITSDGRTWSHGTAWDARRDRVIDGHRLTVTFDGGHGYPFRGTCACGWTSMTYAADHAVRTMHADHVANATTEGV